jgi:hypothetical protein
MLVALGVLEVQLMPRVLEVLAVVPPLMPLVPVVLVMPLILVGSWAP